MRKQKSFVLKPADAKRGYFLIDASGRTVGRLASEIAGILRGKQNPQYTPHTDSGGVCGGHQRKKSKIYR